MDRTIELIELNNNLSQLNTTQKEGITTYGLKEQDVRTPNFGVHTLKAMRHLKIKWGIKNYREAFSEIKHLNESQTKGVAYFDLTRDQVCSSNFGVHTLDFMLRENRKEKITMQQAFRLVQGLNNTQIYAMSHYRLSRPDVETKNFGQHTIDAMQTLRFRAIRAQDNTFNFQNAFQLLQGLDISQARGITEYQLSIYQVVQPHFGERILPNMDKLRSQNPTAESQHIYETALAIAKDPRLGIEKNQRVPEKLATERPVGNFQNPATKADGSASPRTVADIHEHLKFIEDLDSKEALATALSLKSKQIKGIVNFGLRLYQVQHPYFTNTEGILESLAHSVKKISNDDTFDFNFTFDNEEDRQLFRKVFDARLISYETALDKFHPQNSVQNTKKTMLAPPIVLAEVKTVPTEDTEQKTNKDQTYVMELEALKILRKPQLSRLDSLEYSDSDNSFDQPKQSSNKIRNTKKKGSKTRKSNTKFYNRFSI